MVKITLITGDGRGKTSTSMGHIYLEQFRNKSIIVAQFLKTGKNCGECNFFRNFYFLKWFTFGKDEFLVSEEQTGEFREIISNGIDEITEELNLNEIDIVLLDEIGIAFSYNLLKWENLQPIIKRVKEEIIITGREVPDIIKNKVNEIIQIEEIKHPFNVGIIARKGIDY